MTTKQFLLWALCALLAVASVGISAIQLIAASSDLTYLVQICLFIFLIGTLLRKGYAMRLKAAFGCAVLTAAFGAVLPLEGLLWTISEAFQSGAPSPGEAYPDRHAAASYFLAILILFAIHAVLLCGSMLARRSLSYGDSTLN